MPPRSLEVVVFRLLDPDTAPEPHPLRRLSAVDALQSELERIERRERWRSVLRFLKACAAHLVLEGDQQE
ncbi:MAG: hypothetical protein ACE14L_02105 [Terriglobales bacterium]